METTSETDEQDRMGLARRLEGQPQTPRVPGGRLRSASDSPDSPSMADIACRTCGEAHLACLVFRDSASPDGISLGRLARRGWPPLALRAMLRMRGVLCRNCLYKERAQQRSAP